MARTGDAPGERRAATRTAEELFLGDAPVDAATRADFHRGVSLVIDAIQGAAVRAVALDDLGPIEREPDLLTDLARGVVAAGRPQPGRTS